MSVKRRDIVIGAAALATGAGVVGALRPKTAQSSAPNKSDLAAPNISQNMRQFRLATSWPKDFPGLGQMPNYIADMVRTMSGGRLDIKVYAAGELVGGLECFDATSTGAADMYHAAEYYWQGKAKGFSFFTAVPLGMTAAEIMGWIDHGGGQQLWDDLSKGFNIKPLQAGNTGHQTGGWFKREINSLEDFRGLRMRIPGLGGEMIRRLGGTAVTLAGGEIFQALQSGAIDATEWVGPWNDVSFGFHREAQHYYAPGFHEPGASLALGINLQVWDSLSAEDQAIFKAACAAANHYSLGEYTVKNGYWLQVLKTDYGIEPKIFNDDILREVGRIGDEVVTEFAQADAVTRRIYESYLASRNTSRSWTEMSDGLFIKARQIALGQ
ncbi:TRAP transporter substrate-binding protein [Litorimonas sp. RW-G-Af-16]|uniref:TRAP transporter substrate-binding protein n=1 Tax=Litorimonas sp. RW-G-Af-16 TaxID=3241168 RepID=UPI00390CC100